MRQQDATGNNSAANFIMRGTTMAAIVFCSFICLSFTKVGEYFRPTPPLFRQIDQMAARAGLGLQTISITGFNVTSDDDIFAALGLENAQSLLSFDAHSARARLEMLPWVRSAQIKQTFPDRLDVAIQEHRAYALWTRGNDEIVVNRDGRQLAVVRAGAVRDLPNIAGKGAPQAAQALFRYLEKYSELSPVSLRAVRVADRRWTLILQDLRRVLLPEKHYGEALAMLMSGRKGERLIDRNFASIDLRTPGQIVLRPQRSSQGLKKSPSMTLHRSTHHKRVLKG